MYICSLNTNTEQHKQQRGFLQVQALQDYFPLISFSRNLNFQSDVFSFGIILCELIARIDADPDILPRTGNFGVDYLAFSEKLVPKDCPAELLVIAYKCVNVRDTTYNFGGRETTLS